VKGSDVELPEFDFWGKATSWQISWIVGKYPILSYLFLFLKNIILFYFWKIQ